MRAVPLLLLSFLLATGCEGATDDASSSPTPSSATSPPGGEPINADGDSVPAGEDCDDTNPNVYPGAQEVCDGVDNNCEGHVDETDQGDPLGNAPWWYPDGDGDGYGRPEGSYQACSGGDGDVLAGGDCDDQNPAIHPGIEERCGDGVDNNCDGTIDENLLLWYPDGDLDGYGVTGQGVADCGVLTGHVLTGEDCDDAHADVHPDAYELCDNGVDDDCEGRDLHCGIEGIMELKDAAAVISGGQTYDRFGGSIAAGDLNGDGYADILTCAGSIYDTQDVVFGHWGYLFGTRDVEQADFSVLTGCRVYGLGPVGAPAVDIDGDGVSDLLVAQLAEYVYNDSEPWRAQEPEQSSGPFARVLVFHGPINGPMNDEEADYSVTS